MSREASREQFNKRIRSQKDASELKKIQQAISAQADIVRSSLLNDNKFKDFFANICGDQSKKAARLSKQKFKQFLQHHFGINIGEKACIMLDFSQAVTSQTYIDQVVNILKESPLMNEIVFDIFDTSNDDKLS